MLRALRFSGSWPGLPDRELTMARLASVVVISGILFILAAPAGAQFPRTVFLEELTWTEVRDAIQDGATTAIIPTAGTEQNGPHMVLGKHRFIIEHAVDLIARRLGNTIVAPVVTYVPEGDVDPPSGHMRYAGTITLPNEFFVKLVEYAARSLAAHGFTDIVLIGDSGGNQRGMEEVATTLNAEWSGTSSELGTEDRRRNCWWIGRTC